MRPVFKPHTMNAYSSKYEYRISPAGEGKYRVQWRPIEFRTLNIDTWGGGLFPMTFDEAVAHVTQQVADDDYFPEILPTETIGSFTSTWSA